MLNASVDDEESNVQYNALANNADDEPKFRQERTVSGSSAPADPAETSLQSVTDLFPAEAEKEAAGDASVFTSVVNLSAAILGAGMIGLPYGFAMSGYVIGFLLLGGSAIISGFTMHLLAQVSHEVAGNKATFYAVAQQTMSRGMWIVEVLVILNCFGLATSYLVVFGETMPYVVGKKPNCDLGTNQFLWVTIGLVFVLPMAFAPTLDMLRFTSGGGMACTVYLAIIVWYYYSAPNGDACRDDSHHGGGEAALSFTPTPGPTELPEHCGGDFVPAVASIGIMQMLSIVTFAFTAHIQLVSVKNEVRTRGGLGARTTRQSKYMSDTYTPTTCVARARSLSLSHRARLYPTTTAATNPSSHPGERLHTGENELDHPRRRRRVRRAVHHRWIPGLRGVRLHGEEQHPRVVPQRPGHDRGARGH